MTGRAPQAIALAAATVALALPAVAHGDWVVRGKGFGSGVGMSQYGAYGMAKQGFAYPRILRHYYRDVRVGQARVRNVRVLVASGLGSLPFHGAERACGQRLNPRNRYEFTTSGGGIALRKRGGAHLAGCGREGAASGGNAVIYDGVGGYRGKLVARNAGGLYAINLVSIDDYVRGVIANEMSPSWHRQALRAQAVAARSFALATRIGGNGYDLYDDTRSQVYGGVRSEHRRTDAAVRATAGEVIRHSGEIVPAYFFSSSGGRTENSEFGFSGGSRRPYLKSVRDPYDDISPEHRWRLRLSNAEMESRLSGLFSGRLRKIRILKTGRSPRIVKAKVVGTRGSSRVTGDTLRYRLGLRSTWARFRKR